MAQEEYIYAVTRAHNHEQGLLSEQDLEQLISAPTVAEAYRMLTDKGWGSPDLPANDVDALVAFETERTWELICELVGDLTPFDVFRVKNDFHNLKAAIKLEYSADDENEKGDYFLKYGTVDIDAIKKAAADHDFSSLPDNMAEAGRAAYEALAHAASGQASDIVIDRATLLAIDEAGQKSTSGLLQEYARLVVDVANIKAAVRCCIMKKSRDFIEQVIAPVGSLDTKELASAAAESLDAIYNRLENTRYSGAIDELKTSMAAFERWCDDALIELIRPQRYNYFSIEPLAAFILGRENEIAMVRLIISAKINNLSEDALRQRLRRTYV